LFVTHSRVLLPSLCAFYAGTGGGVASRTASASQGHGAFALATGLRAANIAGLTWEQVDLPRKQAWVYPDQAKARRAIPVPFNEAALEVVTRQQGNPPVHVFTREPGEAGQYTGIAGVTLAVGSAIALAVSDL
jgi:integrase